MGWYGSHLQKLKRKIEGRIKIILKQSLPHIHTYFVKPYRQNK